MPEIVSKFPDITIKVLQRAGAKCGPGVTKKILTSCPDDRFCSLPSGEFCVFGLKNISSMTQISSLEWRSAVGILSETNITLWALFFFFGFLVGYFLNYKRP